MGFIYTFWFTLSSTNCTYGRMTALKPWQNQKDQTFVGMLVWRPYQLSHIDALSINLFYWPKDQSHSILPKILRISGFRKNVFFLIGHFGFFYLLNPMKSRQMFLGSKNGSKFWLLSWFPTHEVLGQHLCTGMFSIWSVRKWIIISNYHYKL